MTTYAKDCKCYECGKKAVCFWPAVDPDIPSYPYCRKCVDQAKYRVMIKLFGPDSKN
jgi:hypothetical protein